MSEKLKIAVLGGSFNPIHNGHLILVESFEKLIAAEKVLIIPTNIPPHKSALDMTESRHRFNMCKLAVEQKENYEVSDIEIKRQGLSYTVDTLAEIKRIYPDSEIYLICGSDMFLTLQKWYKYEEIIKECVICAASRGDNPHIMEEYKQALEKQGAKVIIKQYDIPPFSSTAVRDRIKAGLSAQNMIPQKVYEYIKNNNLYGE